MSKIPHKRPIYQYRNALIYMQTALQYHEETKELTSEIQPLLPEVEALVQEEQEWTENLLQSKARLLAAHQSWKLNFNRLLKLLNTFEYASIRHIQDPILDVYPRGNRGPDYDVQAQTAKSVFEKLLASAGEMPENIKAGIQNMLQWSNRVLEWWETCENLLQSKKAMLCRQEEKKNEVNSAVQKIEKKLRKMFPYEQRYLQAFFYK